MTAPTAQAAVRSATVTESLVLWQLLLEPARSSDSDFNPDPGPLAPCLVAAARPGRGRFASGSVSDSGGCTAGPRLGPGQAGY
jgi:hypothetical protein